MKKVIKIICFIAVYLTMLSSFIVTSKVNFQAIAAEVSTSPESEKPAAEERETALDDNIQKDAKEIDFIQKKLCIVLSCRYCLFVINSGHLADSSSGD